jgi:putative ABC transport system substrate-binding protein
MFFNQRDKVVKLAAEARVPSIYESRDFVEAGGLMSYGAGIVQNYRRLAFYVDISKYVGPVNSFRLTA